jgi:hypothetical protein
MRGISWHRRCSIKLAMWIDKLKRVKKITAFVALITSSIVVLASGAGTLNEAVCWERLVFFTVWLRSCPLLEIAILA